MFGRGGVGDGERGVQAEKAGGTVTSRGTAINLPQWELWPIAFE